MHTILTRLSILFILLCCSGMAFSQVSFTLKISDKKIGKADILQAEYTLANAPDADNFRPPVFTNWQVVSGPSVSQQTTIINNHTEQSISYVYSLLPKKTGSLQVPGSAITAGGKQLFCKAAEVEVSDKPHVALSAPQQPTSSLQSLFDEMQPEDVYASNPVLKPNENPAEKIKANIFVKVSANKNTCYVGEPVLVTYQLFSALRAQPKVVKQPAFSGCSVLEMTNPDEPTTVQKINGKNYRVFIIRKVQLVPLQEGALNMDTASVQNEVTFSSPADPYQTQTFSATLHSNALSITVKALPEANKPAHFTGVVGKFHISAKTDSATIPAGENNNLQVTISGEGNFEGIPSPVVQWPAGLEHFDGTDSPHIDKMSFPVKGDQTFTIPFIGTKEGRFTLPQIGFTFFDAGTQTYETVYSDSIPVTVTHALAKNEQYKDIVTEDITNRKYLWIVPAIALTAGFVWIISSRKRKIKPTPAKQKEAFKTEAPPVAVPIKNKTDFNYYLQSLAGTEDNRLFFTQAKALLTQALQEKLGTAENIENNLTASLKSANEALAVEAEQIYAVCNRSLYSPIVTSDEKDEMVARLTTVIDALNA